MCSVSGVTTAMNWLATAVWLANTHGVKVVSELLGHSDVFDHAPDLRPRGIPCFPGTFERSGEPVVMKLLRNGFPREIDFCK
jgi:hypothetical protein